MQRIRHGSGTEWERKVGYSRAIRVGQTIHVSGTTAVDEEGRVLASGDAAGQTAAAIEKIARALRELGADLEDVVRTRIYVTDIARWEEIGAVHGRYFASIRPAATMVEVTRLIDPEILVEIEVEAIVGE